MLEVKNINKKYKTGDYIQIALDNVSLSFRENEFVAILGPSGSGKTTLLNIIGGLDRYDSGDLIINNVSTKKYKDRDWDAYRNHTIGFVFQSYNLIPHQNILANVELALTISGVSKKERRQRALYALKQVGLEKQGHKKPNQLSGGQMQRVAIARALVNNPDILLADEPTGALDSETSIQVMELLKEVAKDRLVVMVTHNPELADQYASRIVKLKDGKIESDSNPYKGNNEIAKHKSFGKSSMSFLTALSLSFNNLKTKKARTILTSFAGSIGIIGIALIMALSNGVSQYINDIEEETLSQYPLMIQSSGIDITSMLVDSSENNDAENRVEVAQMITNMFSKISSNDLESLKTYLESGESDINQYVNSIDYLYDVVPHIYNSDTSTIHQVNPDQLMNTLGMGSSSNNMLSSMMSTNMFNELPGDSSLYEDQYDIKAGHWPENYNECVVVLTNRGKISDYLLYTLGLRDYSEMEAMLRQFSNNEDVTTPDDISSYSYDEIMDVSFKLVNSTDYYEFDSQYNIYRDKSNDDAYMKSLIDNGEDLKIVGIVQPKAGSTVSMLSTGIWYPQTLTEHIIDKSAQSEIVQKQLANPSVNVITNQSFEEENQEAFDMSSIITVDSDVLSQAITFDQSQLNLSMDNLDLSNIQIDMSSLPAVDMSQALNNIEITVSDKQSQQFYQSLMTDYQQYLTENDLTDPALNNEYFQAYLQSQRAQSIIQASFMSILNENGVFTAMETAMQQQMQTVMVKYMSQMQTQIQTQIAAALSKQLNALPEQIQNAISFDTEVFASAFSINMTEDELMELMMSFASGQDSSYESVLADLQYANKEVPSGINIYPLDFESKEFVIDILDQYNEDMEKTDESKVISYTDYVGTLMSSVTDIIDVISYVLIAFVSISLVVSSIMIGVITYISVLERIKEIGILRAIGASKHHISEVFNAETFIIGLLSGLMGIGITLLLLIPGNMIIHDIAGNNDINALLPASAAIILVILSVVLTLIGGIIPSSLAARKDPVEALRNE